VYTSWVYVAPVIAAAAGLASLSRPESAGQCLYFDLQATVVTINRPSARTRVYGSDRRNVKVIPTVAHRHVHPDSRFLVFVCMNVRSLSPAKLDDLLVELRDRSLDVMLLCETWHDVDSVVIRRLRADGFRVVERARPRPHRTEATLSVNHGGVAIAAVAGVRLTKLDIGFQPSSFECVAARVSSGASSCIVVVIYRHPGSSAVTITFFAELADVLDRLSTFVDPLVLAGDVNLRLERMSDPHTVEFCDLVAGYGLVLQVRGPTHGAGGTLDVVCTRNDLPAPTVDVSDVGLSHHCLLCWSSCLLRHGPPPVYVTSTRRS